MSVLQYLKGLIEFRTVNDNRAYGTKTEGSIFRRGRLWIYLVQRWAKKRAAVVYTVIEAVLDRGGCPDRDKLWGSMWFRAPVVGIEWDWDPGNHCLGFFVEVHSGQEKDVGIQCSFFLATVFFSASGILPLKWLPQGSARSTGLSIDTDCFRWSVWNRQFDWRSWDPWWMRGEINFRGEARK